MSFLLRFVAPVLLVVGCLPAAVPIGITSNPAGRAFTVAGDGCGGGSYATPQTLSWTPGSACTLTFPSVQDANPATNYGTRYVFTGWSDGVAANPRTIAAPGQPATYNASFKTQYNLTSTVTPAGAGTVTGTGWYDAGTTATVTAAPSSGYRFVNWSDAVLTQTSGAQTGVSMLFGGQSVLANFVPILAGPPGQYVVTQVSSSPSAPGKPINNFGQVVGGTVAAWGGGFLWTPLLPNGNAGAITDVGGVILPVNPWGDLPHTAAAGINDRGQVVGTTNVQNSATSVAAQAFLWSPDTPNGTIGSVSTLPGGSVFPPFTPNPGFLEINSFGQVGGYLGLWTPSAANGVNGALNQGPLLSSVSGINDYGQTVSGATLFTPAFPNSGQGSSSQISGLPGGSQTTLVAINNRGTVLGMSCMQPVPVIGCASWHGFVWTPASPNGNVGTVTEIPLPPGFASMTPVAINSSGQVVGALAQAIVSLFPFPEGTPFLYSGGAVYDLSTLDNGMAGGSAAGINDHGQIVVSVQYVGTYLLSPAVPPPSPAQGSVPVTIASNPPGLAFSVREAACGAGAYTTPQTLYWLPGSSCTVTFLSPQSNAIGTRYVFAETRGTANPQTFVAPAQATTYTASFITQYLLKAWANPLQAGTVVGGGWYNAGSTPTLTVIRASGYDMVEWDWLGGAPYALTTPGTSSVSVPMDRPHSLIAIMSAAMAPPPGKYTVTPITAGVPGRKPINRFGQVVANRGPGNNVLWTPGTPNGTVGTLTDIPVALAINDRGQVAGLTGSFCAVSVVLWTPGAPNGTSGSSQPVHEADGNGTNCISEIAGINSFGQIAGQDGNAFLWTPSAANATTGTATIDSHFNGINGINDFGQAIANASAVATLFTPSTANATTGSFTAIQGLPGSFLDELQDINNSGTVVGRSCMAVPAGGGCNWEAFLWTPATPGVTAIPLPAGAVSMSPVAMNASGQIVGNLVRGDGSSAPFLWTGGQIFDLTAIAGVPVGSLAGGINDRGQIVIGGNGSVLLLTPQEPPAPTSVSPGAGSGLSQTFVFTFTDPRGWQDLDVVDILINTSLDGRNACYVAYSVSAGKFYLVNDAGAALLPGVANSQCALAGSSASGTGNVLTVTLNLSFTASFAGNQVIYAAGRDLEGGNSGWQPLGTWTVPPPPAAALAVGGMSPAHSSGFSQTYKFTFTDTNGWQDISVANILIASALDGRRACYMAFVPTGASSGHVFLVDDAGDAAGPYSVVSIPPDIFALSAANGQCSVSIGTSSASGNTLTLTVAIGFTSGFAGNRVIYAATRSNTQTSGWQAVGTVSVNDPAAPVIAQLSPSVTSVSNAQPAIAITGSNFQQSVACAAACGIPCPGPSVITFDHNDVPTQFVSPTEVRGTIPWSFLAYPRSVDVTVKNPVVIQCQSSADHVSGVAQFTIVP